MKKNSVKFPTAFEIIVWIIYALLYKYSYYLDLIAASDITNQYFPFPTLVIYAFFSSLYIIPFYRLIIPFFLQRQQYVFLLLATLFYFAFITKLSNLLIDYCFSGLSSGGFLHTFYAQRWNLSVWRMQNLFSGWDLKLIITDIIAFTCIAFVRFSFENEDRRHQLEKSNLQLQLSMLKTQLQPHFLFNTLNSIYSFSLLGSPDTSRFILLLSDMMRYILYDCNKDYISIAQEVAFLKNYFEMEQNKYPNATIQFEIKGDLSGTIAPLLFLPLIENSFKHGAHHILDVASVNAVLELSPETLKFTAENDVYNNEMIPKKAGGIGLNNIKQRLELYYPGKYKLSTTEINNTYRSQLVLFI